MKDAVSLQIELELDHRGKFNVEVFKIKIWFWSGVSGMIDLCPELGAFAKFIHSWILVHSSSMDEDILMKFAGLMHHRIGFIGIL